MGGRRREDEEEIGDDNSTANTNKRKAETRLDCLANSCETEMLLARSRSVVLQCRFVMLLTRGAECCLLSGWTQPMVSQYPAIPEHGVCGLGSVSATALSYHLQQGTILAPHHKCGAQREEVTIFRGAETLTQRFQR